MSHYNYRYNPMSEALCKQVLRRFTNIKQNVNADIAPRMSLQQIAQQIQKCSSLLQTMSNNNNYTYFGRISQIQQKYGLIKEVMQQKKIKNLREQQYMDSLKRILVQHNQLFVPHLIEQSSSISDIRSEDVVLPKISRTLEAFFKKKQDQISKKESSFKHILNTKQFQMAGNDTISNKSVSKNSRFSKSHLKKEQQKESKLKNIIEQHRKALANLQQKIKQDQQLNDFQKNLLKQQRNRYIQKMQQLQEEIEQLYRDNYRLKELQKTAKVADSFNMSQLRQKNSLANAYQPYVIKTRKNDLNKINQKNQLRQEAKMQKQRQKQKERSPQHDYLGQKLQNQRPITAHEFFNKKPNNFGLYQQKFPTKQLQQPAMILKDLLGDSFQHSKPPIGNSNNSRNYSIGSIGNGNHFDTFQLAQTLSYINDSALGQSRNMIRMTKQVSTRNKVAFFKSSLVLIRDSQIDIAYKKSELNQKMDKIRLIFYINNRTEKTKRVSINYEYQVQYFQIRVQQKMTQLPPRGQGRQVIQISLISHLDLNGVTDVHIDIADTVYDIWLPVNFIRFRQSSNYRMPADTMEMTVLPDRQFANFSTIQQIIPIMYGGKDSIQTWAYLYGESKFGSYPIKLTWKQKDLTIQTTDKWLDFMGFVLHFFK